MMRSIRFDRGGLGLGCPSTHRLRPGISRNRRAEFIDFLFVGFCCVRGIVAPISSTLPTNQAVCLRIVDGMVKEGTSHIVFCFWTLWTQLTLSVIASGPGSFVLFPSWELHAGVQGRARDCHVHVQARCRLVTIQGGMFRDGGQFLASCPFAVPVAVHVSATVPLWLLPGRVRSGARAPQVGDLPSVCRQFNPNKKNQRKKEHKTNKIK